MVGSIEPAKPDDQLSHLNPVPAESIANPKSQVPRIITSSFLDLSYSNSEVECQPQQPGLPTVISPIVPIEYLTPHQASQLETQCA